MQKNNLIFLPLFFLFALALVHAQERIDTTLNFNFANTIPKVHNCPAGAPRLPNDTLVEVKLGALVDSEGIVNTEGLQYVLAMKVAVRELNTLLESLNAPFFLTLVIKDTASSPDLALSQLEVLVKDGVKLILGPATSAEVDRIQPFLQLHPDVTVISPDSTAIDLAKVDQVYRLFPNDKISATVVAAYLNRKQFDGVVIFYRADLFGINFKDGLEKALATHSPATAIILLPYDNSQITALVAVADQEVTARNLKNFAVVLISFDEWIPIISTAAQYPNLSKATLWIGPELTFNDSPRPTDPIADKSDVLSISVHIPKSDLSDALRSTFLGLAAPLPRGAFFAYDSVYLAFFSFILPRSWNNPQFNYAINYAADSLYLTTGRVAFDEFGDRALDAQFDVFRYRNGTILVVSSYSNGVFTDKKF